MSKTRIILCVAVTVFVATIAVAVVFILMPRKPRTLIVPDKYKTIKKAIAKARSGDTVLVKAGEYFETIYFKDGIKLIGEGCDKTTIQYPASQGRVLRIEDCNSGLIANLTFDHNRQDGDPNRSAVRLKRSNVEFVGCKVINSARTGLAVEDASKALILYL